MAVRPGAGRRFFFSEADMNREEMKRRIYAAVDENAAEIERIARTVYEHPELGYKETFGTVFIAASSKASASRWRRESR